MRISLKKLAILAGIIAVVMVGAIALVPADNTASAQYPPPPPPPPPPPGTGAAPPPSTGTTDAPAFVGSVIGLNGTLTVLNANGTIDISCATGLIATLNPATLTPGLPGSAVVTLGPGASVSCTATIFYLGVSPSNGANVYQINIYDNGTLISDNTLIFVFANSVGIQAR